MDVATAQGVGIRAFGGRIETVELTSRGLRIAGWVRPPDNIADAPIILLRINGGEFSRSPCGNKQALIDGVPTAVFGYEILVPLSRLPKLINLATEVSALHQGEEFPQVWPDGRHDLAKLQMATPRLCLESIQNPAYRLRDRGVLMQLAQEAMLHFPDNAEIPLAAACVLAYGYIENPTATAGFLPKIFELESSADTYLQKLNAGLSVRWGTSLHTGMAYVHLKLGQLEEAAKAFRNAAGSRAKIALWPSVDLNIARSLFALGCIETIQGAPEQAMEHWRAVVDFAKEATAVKTFNYYYKIEETREMWNVALASEACVSLTRIRLGKGNSIDGTLRSMLITPSKVCGYLSNLDSGFSSAARL